MKKRRRAKSNSVAPAYFNFRAARKEAAEQRNKLLFFVAARKKFQLFFCRVCLFEAAIAGLYCCSAVERLGVHRLIEKVSGRRSLLWRLLSSCDRVTSALFCQLCLVRFVQISCSRARLCKSQRAWMLSVRLDGVSTKIMLLIGTKR